MSAKEHIMKAIEQVGAVKHGDYKLSSGGQSDYYFDSTAFNKWYPATGGVAIKELILQNDPILMEGTLIGLPYKGIPLAAQAAMSLAKKDEGRGIFSYAFLRKPPEDIPIASAKNLLAGQVTRPPYILVDDVLTTGKTVRWACRVLESQGIKPHYLMVIVNRAVLSLAPKLESKEGIIVKSLFDARELWKVEDK